MRSRVSLDDLDQFETDEDGLLYWKGKKVVVERRLVIAWWVNAAIIVAGIAAAVSAIVSLLAYVWPPHV